MIERMRRIKFEVNALYDKKYTGYRDMKKDIRAKII